MTIRHVLMVMYVGLFAGLSSHQGVASSFVDEPEVRRPTTDAYHREDLTFFMGKSEAHKRFKRYVCDDQGDPNLIEGVRTCSSGVSSKDMKILVKDLTKRPETDVLYCNHRSHNALYMAVADEEHGTNQDLFCSKPGQETLDLVLHVICVTLFMKGKVH